MGYMKWMYEMVSNDTYKTFKLFYETAKDNNVKEFGWNGDKIRVEFAEYVCKYIDKHLGPEYEEQLIAQAEMQAEWQAEIMRGK